MKKKINRVQRISKILKKEIAYILQKNIQDPRLNMQFSISFVKISNDFSYAKIFFTYLDSKNKIAIENGLRALNQSKKFIRTLLSKSISLRHIPILNFFYDYSFNKSVYITNLIAQTIENDKKISK